jgi:hypothetical protein
MEGLLPHVASSNLPMFSSHCYENKQGHARGRRGGTIDASRQDGKRSLLNEYHGLEIIIHVYLIFLKLILYN